MSLTALLEAGCTPPERGGSLPSVASKPASGLGHDGVRWVYHPHLAMSLAAPGLELLDGDCLLTTAVGRWLVRPATLAAVTRPGPVLANDEPRLVCMGTAEFLPGVVPGIPIKSAARGAEVAYRERSATPG